MLCVLFGGVSLQFLGLGMMDIQVQKPKHVGKQVGKDVNIPIVVKCMRTLQVPSQDVEGSTNCSESMLDQGESKRDQAAWLTSDDIVRRLEGAPGM